MQELISVPSSNLHKSEILSLDQLSLVEPLSIGAHAIARASIEPGEFVLVVGAGPIGLAVIQFAQLEGARVIVLDVIEERMSFARTCFPVEAAITAGEGAVEQIREITGGDLPTAVFDATGNLRSMIASFDLPAHGGRLVLVGLCQGEVSFHDQEAHRRELTMSCSRNATASDFQRVIGLLEAGAVDVAPWITHRVAFGEEVIEQFPVWLEPESRFIKAVIEI
jgi:hypothetical protein